MNKKILFAVLILIALGVPVPCPSANDQELKMTSTATYGTKVVFSRDQVIAFPDFTFKFLGSAPAPQPFPDIIIPLGDFYKFEVAANHEIKNFSWSSGTGDIAPMVITISNKIFFADLGGLSKEGGWVKIGPPYVEVACGSIPVAFHIPKFKDWQDIQNKEVADNRCRITISWSGFVEIPPGSRSGQAAKPPSVIVDVSQRAAPDPEMHSAAIFTNPQGIQYRFLDDPKLKRGQNNFAEFRVGNGFVKIEAMITSNHFGFAPEEFWNTVAGSLSPISVSK